MRQTAFLFLTIIILITLNIENVGACTCEDPPEARAPREALQMSDAVFVGTVTNITPETDPHGLDITWAGTDERGQPAPSGVYFYRFDAGVVSGTKKMILMR